MKKLNGAAGKNSTAVTTIRETSFEQFALRYNPDKQKAAVTHAAAMVTRNDYPTLTDALKTFGEANMLEWLQAQIIDLCEFCGAKGKLNGRQIVQLCDRFLEKFHYIKVSEYLLFFGNMKDGKYGEFIGNIDPQRILARFTKDFMRERAEYLDAEAKAQAEAERNKRREGCITYEQYCKSIGRPVGMNPIESLLRQSSSK